MQALGVLLRDDVTRASVVPVEWGVLASQFGSGPAPHLLRDLVAEAQSRTSGADGGLAGERERGVDFGGLEPAERQARLVALVRRELATVLGLSGSPESIPADQSFPSLGLDSLTSVELRNRLQHALGRSLPATAAFEWPTVADMSAHLGAMFGGSSEGGGAVGGRAEDAGREELTL